MFESSEQSNQNSAGRRIAATPEALSNFWNWFKGSKVVDESGRPLIVYHGSPTPEFDEFDPSYSSDETLAYGKGVYLTVSSDAASGYATSGSSWGNKSEEKQTGGVYPLYARIVNPFDLNKMYSYNVLKKLTESLDMGDSLGEYEESATYSGGESDELERLEDALYRLEGGDKDDFYEISGYEEHQYINDDGVYDEAEFEKDLEAEIANVKKKIQYINQKNETAYNQHTADLESRGLISGKEIYVLMYTHTVGYHDYNIEKTLIGGDSDLFEFKTEANEILKENGFDGITHIDKYNPGDNKTPHKVFIAFDSNQVKSAIGNSGSYDNSNKIINESTSFAKVFYRGLKNGSPRSNLGYANWDSCIFVADNLESAKTYGTDRILKVTAKPDARILYEGSRDYSKIFNVAKKGKSRMIEILDALIGIAKSGGYDAVWFKQQTDLGTAIINKSSFYFEEYEETI